MNKRIMDKETIRVSLAKKYIDNLGADDHCLRELLIHPINGFPEARVLLLSGSGPKGYGFYFPVDNSHYTLTLYDFRGKIFKKEYLQYPINFNLNENDD